AGPQARRGGVLALPPGRSVLAGPGPPTALGGAQGQARDAPGRRDDRGHGRADPGRRPPGRHAAPGRGGGDRQPRRSPQRGVDPARRPAAERARAAPQVDGARGDASARHGRRGAEGVGVHPGAAGRQAGERRGLNPHPQPLTPRGEGQRRFPRGFLWGTSSAAYQVEGDNKNCDWWEFEQQPGRIANGDTSALACDHYHRYREDFKLLRDLNQNAHRLSIEWSRIEPSEGEFDSRQIRHYRDVLGELREQGILPMVTLHHFTSPLWFVRKGGWTAPGAARAFMPFVHRVADELGDLAGMWCTINEPSIYGAQGWITGDFPPGHHGDLAGQYRVTCNMQRAHELAYLA